MLNRPLLTTAFLILFLPFYSCTQTGNAQTEPVEYWKGIISYDDAEVPFHFELNRSDSSITLINGNDRSVLNDVDLRSDSVIAAVFAFDITLKAKIWADSMSGKVIKHYRSSEAAFSALKGEPRYKLPVDNSPVSLPDSLAIAIRYDGRSPYGGTLLLQQDGERVTGTVMTELSDFRYFEGVVIGDSLSMSSFDGVHAFLLTGSLKDGKWSGDLQLDNGYKEAWRSYEEGDPVRRDAASMVGLSGKKLKPDLSIYSEGGLPIDPEQYRGKVLLLQIMGTWCPNSWDQTRYFVERYDDWKEKGVEILAVNYEANYSKEYGNRRISEYSEKLGIKYPMILGGRLSKQEAAEALPFSDRIQAFPTLVVIDKKGYARHVFSYFTGPATGSAYLQFQDELEQILAELTD